MGHWIRHIFCLIGLIFSTDLAVEKVQTVTLLLQEYTQNLAVYGIFTELRDKKSFSVIFSAFFIYNRQSAQYLGGVVRPSWKGDLNTI